MGTSIPQNRSVQSLLKSFALLPLFLFGCSESTNVMGLIATSASKQDAAAMLSRSRILFDSGDYEGALRAAEEAYSLAPDCGPCAVQVGYCHLGVAGLDMFQLARKMLEKNAAEDKSETATQLIAESNASGQLGSLASLVGLEISDYEAITLPGNRIEDLEGAPQSGPFRTLPVLLPKTALEARLAESSKLYHMARAVEAICAFMPTAVKILGENGDIRHNDASCIRDDEPSKKLNNALFTWAISHLVEAIAFHQIVLYSQDGGLPNLQKRAAILGNPAEIGNVTEYVKAVRDLASLVDMILPTDITAARSSMLTAMFNDLQTVSLAFQGMAAVPAELSKGIIDAIAELEVQREQIGTSAGADGKDEGSVAFKDQLTEGLATELKQQIEKKMTAGELSEGERLDLCTAYHQISTQEFVSCDTP